MTTLMVVEEVTTPVVCAAASCPCALALLAAQFAQLAQAQLAQLAQATHTEVPDAHLLVAQDPRPLIRA